MRIKKIYTPFQMITNKILNTLDSDSETDALSAKQGKILNEKIKNNESEILSMQNFSTDEVKTGETWINGKPIYRKVINIGSINKAKQTLTNTGITDFDDIIFQRGIGFNGTNYSNALDTFVYIHSSGTLYCSTYNENEALSKCYNIVLYTKTTD